MSRRRSDRENDRASRRAEGGSGATPMTVRIALVALAAALALPLSNARAAPMRPAHTSCATNPACVIPNDPLFPFQWGLQNDSGTTQPPGTQAALGADADVPQAWRHSLSDPSVTVAVVDTGIDLSHPDLAGKVLASRAPSASGSATDRVGHGTAVAGIIAAVAGNGIGIAGAGYRASLLNVKVATDDNGKGTTSCSGLADGVVWAVAHGARIINVSIEGPDCSPLRSAVAEAWSRGALVVAAAGNEGDTDKEYPAAYDGVISVAATDNADRRTTFSNRGADWVDLAAPGDRVYTTCPTYATPLGCTDYGYVSGTSFSAALVSGVAALVWTQVTDQNDNGRVNDEVADRLLRYADPIAETGTAWRYGRVNACRAVVADTQSCGNPVVQGAGQAQPAGTSGPKARALPRLTLAAAARHARWLLARHFGAKFRSAKARHISCRHTSRTAATCRVSFRSRGRVYAGRVRVRYRSGRHGAVLRSAVSVRRR